MFDDVLKEGCRPNRPFIESIRGGGHIRFLGVNRLYWVKIWSFLFDCFFVFWLNRVRKQVFRC